jgi:hypothetical protein
MDTSFDDTDGKDPLDTMTYKAFETVKWISNHLDEDDKLIAKLDEKQIRSQLKELLGLIREKEHNMKMAAEIGQSLLEANNSLKAAYDELLRSKPGSPPSSNLNPFCEEDLTTLTMDTESVENVVSEEKFINRRLSTTSDLSITASPNPFGKPSLPTNLKTPRTSERTPSSQRTSNSTFTPLRSTTKRELFSRRSQADLTNSLSLVDTLDASLTLSPPQSSSTHFMSPSTTRRASLSNASPRFDTTDYATSLEQANASLTAQLRVECARTQVEKANISKLEESLELARSEIQRLLSQVEVLEKDKARLVREKLEARRELAAFMSTIGNSDRVSLSGLHLNYSSESAEEHVCQQCKDRVQSLEDKLKSAESLRKEADKQAHETLEMLRVSEEHNEALAASASNATQMKEQITRLEHQAEDLRNQLEEERTKYAELEAATKTPINATQASPWKAGMPGYSPLIGYPRSPYYRSQFTINTIFGNSNESVANQIPFPAEKIPSIDSAESSRPGSPTNVETAYQLHSKPAKISRTDNKAPNTTSPTRRQHPPILSHHFQEKMEFPTTKPLLANMAVQTFASSIFDEIAQAMESEKSYFDTVDDNADDDYTKDESPYFTPEGLNMSRESSHSRMESFVSAKDSDSIIIDNVDTMIDSLSREDGDQFDDEVARMPRGNEFQVGLRSWQRLGHSAFSLQSDQPQMQDERLKSSVRFESLDDRAIATVGSKAITAPEGNLIIKLLMDKWLEFIYGLVGKDA